MSSSRAAIARWSSELNGMCLFESRQPDDGSAASPRNDAKCGAAALALQLHVRGVEMKAVFLMILSSVAVAACTSSDSGVTGDVRAVGGIDACHDEDGDPLFFRLEAYIPSAYVGYGASDLRPVASTEIEACGEFQFDLALPAGRYDIALQAFQEIAGILFDVEAETIVRDVRVSDGEDTDLGPFELDVNDDDEPRAR